jgi:hypothetical protein
MNGSYSRTICDGRSARALVDARHRCRKWTRTSVVFAPGVIDVVNEPASTGFNAILDDFSPLQLVFDD